MAVYKELMNVPHHDASIEEWYNETAVYMPNATEHHNELGEFDPFKYDEAGNLKHYLADQREVTDDKTGKKRKLKPTYFLETVKVQANQVPYCQIIEQVNVNGIEFIRHVKTMVTHTQKDGSIIGIPIAFRLLDLVEDKEDGCFRYEAFDGNMCPKEYWYTAIIHGWHVLGHGRHNSYETPDKRIVVGLKNFLFDTHATPLRIMGRTPYEGVTSSELKDIYG